MRRHQRHGSTRVVDKCLKATGLKHNSANVAVVVVVVVKM
jgi:hypothetical protein